MQEDNLKSSKISQKSYGFLERKNEIFASYDFWG
jgi:hypothetical protein